jgi:hypothetical protein
MKTHRRIRTAARGGCVLASCIGLVASIGISISTPTSASIAARQQSDPTPEELLASLERTMAAATLRRETMLAALASLGRDVAAIVADDIFARYAARVGPAHRRFIERCFPVIDGQVARPVLEPAAMIEAANAIQTEHAAATIDAIAELARAAARSPEEAENLAADLHRRLLAAERPIGGYAADPNDVSWSDALSMWDDLARERPVHAALRGGVESSAVFAAGLATFRGESRQLALDQLGEFGKLCAFYAGWSEDRIPPALALDREAAKSRRAAWLAANDAMADAIARAIETVGTPADAAAWLVHYLPRAHSDALPTSRPSDRSIAVVVLLGISDEERTALAAIEAESMVSRARRYRTLVDLTDAWFAADRKRGRTALSSPPPERLIEEFDTLDAFERSSAERMAAVLRSPFVRARAQRIAEADAVPHLIPLWRAIQTGRATMQGIDWAPAQQQPPQPQSES